MDKIKKILSLFGLESENFKAAKINSGHINSTYKIIYSDDRCYILQQINGKVFKKPEEIMSNIEKVSECLKGNINCPEFLKCGNKNYIMSENEMWRIYPYISDSVSYVALEDNNKIYEFGKATGKFHSLTQQLNTNEFHTIIDDFHNTTGILNKLIALKHCEYKTEFEFFEKMLAFSNQLDLQNIPLTVTHNDVKCSNVLFDINTSKAITLIDFDTVMPGLSIYDFGDGARSACITDNIFDTEKFSYFCKGYFSYIKPCEYKNYFSGIVCITAELAARYFYDYLTDENYFADKTPTQKLLRCHELINTAKSILKKESEIFSIIKAYL